MKNKLLIKFRDQNSILPKFLNKVKGKLRNLHVDFSKRTIFGDIPKWNRGPTIWDKGTNS